MNTLIPLTACSFPGCPYAGNTWIRAGEIRRPSCPGHVEQITEALRLATWFRCPRCGTAYAPGTERTHRPHCLRRQVEG